MSRVSTSRQSPTPQRIVDTLQAYRDAAALNTAIELDLFTRIAHGTNTVSRIAGELNIPVRGVRVLCDYLVSIGLLETEDQQLKTPADIDFYLNRKSPAFVGNAYHLLYTQPLMRSFERLTETVRAGGMVDNGKPSVTARPEWFDMARGITRPKSASEAFVDAVSLPPEKALKILDIGAGDGIFGIALAQRYPGSVVVALDSAEALKAAQTNADVAKLGTRFQNITGDPMVATLGLEYDAVIIAGFLSQFDEARITSLLMRVHYALKKTGQLLILDLLSDESPAFTRQFAGVRLNMLAATSQGDVYSIADMKSMLESSGFHQAAVQEVTAASATLVTARP